MDEPLSVAVFAETLPPNTVRSIKQKLAALNPAAGTGNPTGHARRCLVLEAERALLRKAAQAFVAATDNVDFLIRATAQTQFF